MPALPVLMYPRWVFARSIVKDGNFSAEHLKMKKPENDVALADGTGFMVTDKPYKEHLAAAKEIKGVQNFAFTLLAGRSHSNPRNLLVTITGP